MLLVFRSQPCNFPHRCRDICKNTVFYKVSFPKKFWYDAEVHASYRCWKF